MGKDDFRRMFREMSVDDIREGISRLNRDIVKIRETEKILQHKAFVNNTVAGGVLITTALILPPLMIPISGFALIFGVGDTINANQITQQRLEHESLRAKFKEIYRARPGRKFHDIAARKQRNVKKPYKPYI